MRNGTVSISSETILKTLLIIGGVWLLYYLRDFVLVLLTAVVIASSIEPITRWFMKYKIPRVIAVIIIYLSVAVGLIGIFYFFLPPLLSDAAAFLSFLPEYLKSIRINEAISELSSSSFLDGFDELTTLKDTVVNIRGALSEDTAAVFRSVSSIFGGLLSFILVVVISFYLAAQERGIQNFLELITPVRHERYVINLWERSQKKIGLWMQGQLLLGLIVGVLVFLGLTVLQVKYALLLAVLAAVFEIIPLIGPILAATPAVILAFLTSFQLGIFTLGLYVIIQQFENHLIYPLVVRKVVGVSPIVVIIALIIGAKLAGFLGLLLAVPVAAALMEFAEDVRKEKLAQLSKST